MNIFFSVEVRASSYTQWFYNFLGFSISAKESPKYRKDYLKLRLFKHNFL